jgi:two-component system, NtrC family, sensor histidine kinase HydH
MTRETSSAKRFENSTVEAGVIAIVFLIVGTLHHVVPHSTVFWHNFFQWLYYGLAMVAAGRFGLRGGLIAAGAALVGYLPHLAEPESTIAFGNYSAQLIALFLTSAVVGMVVDRERRRRKELQAALHELDRVHRELQAGIEQLRRADRLSAVGQLAASLAHEIRNPLASIQGAVSVLDQSGSSDETCRELRAIIWKECGRLQRLLTGMLDFARPHPVEYGIVDVTQKLDQVINLVVHAAAKSRIELRSDVPPDISPLECDPEQLMQVILNLTLNAIQAMPDGGQIALSARQQGSEMIFHVRDQGVGIDAEHLDRIFDPFFTTKSNGTGLGLAVAHRIVSQLGGRIEVQANKPHKGMTFSVTLPIRCPALVREERAAERGSQALSRQTVQADTHLPPPPAT